MLLLWGGVISFDKKSKATRGQSVTCKLEIIRRCNIRASPARVHPTFSDTRKTWTHPICLCLCGDNLQLPIFKIGRLCLNQMCHPAFCILNRSTLFTPGFPVPSTLQNWGAGNSPSTTVCLQGPCTAKVSKYALRCDAVT